MQEHLRKILEDSQIRQSVANAASLQKAVGLIVEAGGRKGFQFDTKDVTQAFGELSLRNSSELSEQELLAVSGGLPSSRPSTFGHTCCGDCYTQKNTVFQDCGCAP